MVHVVHLIYHLTIKTNKMKNTNVKTAALDLKIALVAYGKEVIEKVIAFFSDPVELKVKRITIIMIPLIVVGAFVAWYVNAR